MSSTKTPSLPGCCTSLTLSLSLPLPLSLSLFPRPTRDSSLACSAIDTEGHAPSHCTSSFPLARGRPFPPSLTSSVSLGSSDLVLSSLSVLPPYHRPVRNFPRHAPTSGTSPSSKSIRSCDAGPTLRPACATFVLLGVSCDTCADFSFIFLYSSA